MDDEYIKHETRNRQARAKEYKKKKQEKLYGRIAAVIVFGFIGLIGTGMSTLFTPDPDYLAAKAKEKAEEAKKKPNKVLAQFSTLNGRHYETCRQIKLRLHDPDSFQHLKTNYGRDGKHLQVYTSYRAKNAFGAMVLTTHVATVDLATGNVLFLERYNGGR